MKHLQIFKRMESRNLPLGESEAVNDKVFESVGEIYNRAHTVFPFQTVGIEFGLMLAGCRFHARPFRFDHGKRFSVGSEQHIVGIAYALIVGHPLNFDLDAGLPGLDVALGVEHVPSGFAKQKVDKSAACLGLGNSVP